MPGWLDSIFSKFSVGDELPWTDAEMVADCEREAAQDGADRRDRDESMMRFAWALVHSHQSTDVQRGIAMLATLTGEDGPLDQREILYLLAVGHFRAGDYKSSRRLVDAALECAPDFRQAVALKTMVEDRLAKDGLLGIGLAAGTIGILTRGVPGIFLAGGIAAGMYWRRNYR